MKYLLSVAPILLAALSHASFAADTEKDEKNAFEVIKQLQGVDLTVPGSPAFSILGITPDKVDRPGTRRDFLVSAAQGLGTDGKAVNGLALDFSPMSLFFRKHIKGGSDYAERPEKDKPASDLTFDSRQLKRILARTTVSFGTTSAEQQSDASRSAIGVRVGLIDYADPGLYWGQAADCVRLLPGQVVKSGRELESEPADIETCEHTKLIKGLWAKPSLYLGYGRSWFSSTGKLQDSEGDSTAVWLSGSIGLNGNSDASDFRIFLQAYVGRERNGRETDPLDDTRLIKKNTSEAVLRLKLAKTRYAFFADWGGKKVKLASDTREYIRHTAIAFEYQLFEGADTWLQIAGINEKGFSDGKDVSGITLGLKFGSQFLDSFGSK